VTASTFSPGRSPSSFPPPRSPSSFPPATNANLNGTAATVQAPAPLEFSELRGVGILVVDDDSGVRDAVAEMLADNGARVVVADSAAAAMTAVDEFQPAVVLCDIAASARAVLHEGAAFPRSP